MIGINGYEIIILVVLALVLLGPERLPEYAQTLGRWVRQARGMAEDAKVRFQEETGADFDEIDWQKYDPRQYDPRRIIREALSEEYEESKDAFSSVRRAAELEPGAKGRNGRRGAPARSSARRRGRTLSGGVTGSGGGPTRTRSSPQSPRSAGTAGAAKRSSEEADPRTIFSSSEGTAAGGALAAGMAGAAAEGRVVQQPSQEEEAPQPAPFDHDAT